MNPAPAGLLLRGQVMHERVRPLLHRFVYPVFYVRVNLARLTELNSFWMGINHWRPASLWLRDYGARDGSDPQQWMRQVLQQAGIEADGEIWLQTFPRLLGFAFNPVSFWYCHDARGALRAVLAEVNNTFGESHRYLLTAANGVPITEQTEIQCQKNFHVSPFCQVNGHYVFHFRETDTNSLVRLDYVDDGGVLLKTALGGTTVPLTNVSLRRALFMQPLLTMGIVLGINWQALKLWVKRVPWVSKPQAPNDPITYSTTSHSGELPK